MVRELIRFPYSIGDWRDKSWFRCEFDGVKWLDYRDVIQRCLEMEKYWWSGEERQQ
jgi:hypothetical protein